MRGARQGLAVLVALVGLGALSMLVPAGIAFTFGEHATARSFIYSALLTLVGVLLVGLAIRRGDERGDDTGAGSGQGEGERPLLVLLGAYVVLPPVLAVPFADALGGARFLDAWFEMVSSFTTTGATLYPVPRDLSAPLHFWRAFVGWLGGLFVLVSVMALLAPRDMGGFELLGATGQDRPARARSVVRRLGQPDATQSRMIEQAMLIAPLYAALTLILWIALVLAGNPAMMAVMQAMATLSTSGIQGARTMGPAGFWAEALIFVFLILALTRRSLPGHGAFDRLAPFRRDPELRLAAAAVLLVALIMLGRHWVAASMVDEGENLPAAGRAFWGGAFTALSFLTTTGFVSQDWAAARAWSGLTSPGMVLLGLALTGGGVATTAGGLKLLRIHALMLQGRREFERLIHPSSVGGGGNVVRRMRRYGARAAWIFVMLFMFSLIVIAGLLTMLGVGLERAIIYGVAALTTTGPLIHVVQDAPMSWVELPDPARGVLAIAMVLGRLELMVLLSLILVRSED